MKQKLVFYIFLISLYSLTFSVFAEEVILRDVPAYDYTHGCTPTSGMMVMGYWDNYGFPDLIEGSSSWNENTEQIRVLMASPGDGVYDGIGVLVNVGAKDGFAVAVGKLATLGVGVIVHVT